MAAKQQQKKKPRGKVTSSPTKQKKVKKVITPARKKVATKKLTVKRPVTKKVVVKNSTKKAPAKKPATKKAPVRKVVAPSKTKKEKVKKQVQEKKPVKSPVEPKKQVQKKTTKKIVAPVPVVVPVVVMPPPPPPPPPPPAKTKPYLNNRDLVAEVKASKLQQQMTDKLARMLMLMCSRYAKKGNFVNYSYNEDMQGYALMMLVRTWNAYDPEKSNNAFAFYTQCIKHSFIQFLNQEKRQRMIRDLLLVDNGLTPSFGFTDGNDTHIVEDEEEYYTDSVVEKIIQTAVAGGEAESIPEEKNEDDNGLMKF